MRLVVMQVDVDVKLQLYKIRGIAGQERYVRAWEAIDSPNEYKGPEPVSEIASESGDYLLTVENSLGAYSPGEDYTITFEALHAAGEKDERYVRAERGYLKGWSDLNTVGFLEKEQDKVEAVKKALESLNDALKNLADTNSPALKLDALLLRANALLAAGQSREANDDLNSALELARSFTDRNEKSAALFKVSASLNSVERGEEAKKALEDSLALSGGLTADDKIQRLMTLGNFYQALDGNIQKATELYEQAVRIIPEVPRPSRRSYLLTSAGMFYFSVSRLLKAVDLYNQALAVAGKAIPREQGYTLHQLGVAYSEMGKTQDALNTFSQLRNLRRSEAYLRDIPQTPAAQDEEDLAEVYLLNNLGAAYAELRQPRLALTYYEQSLALNKGGQKEDRYKDAAAFSHLYKGNAHLDLKEEKAARDEYEAAFKLWEKNKRGQANVLVNIGRILYDKGERKKIIDDYLAPAAKLQKDVGYRYGLAYTLTNMGAIYTDLGEYDEASQKLKEALDLRLDVGDKKGEIITLYQQARLERARRKYEVGLEQLSKAKALIEALRGSVLEGSLRSSYFASFHDVYALTVGIYMDLYKERGGQMYAGLALEAAESARARSLLDTVAAARADIRRGVNPVLRERERRAQDRVAEALAGLARSGRGPQAQGSAPALRPFEGEFNRAVEDLRLIRAEIASDTRTGRPYAELTKTESLGSKEIQGMLDGNSLLLEYVLGEPESYLFLVSNKEIRPIPLAGRRKIEALAKEAYEKLDAIGNLPRDMNYDERLEVEKKLHAEFSASMAQLSPLLLGDVADSIGNKRLLLVKDGALQYVPFSALPEPSPSGKGVQTIPLLLNHEIAVLPSATAISATRARPRRPAGPQNTLLMLADPVYNLTDQRAQKSFGGLAGVRGSAPQLQYQRLFFSVREKEEITSKKLIPGSRVKVWEGFEVKRSNVMSGELSRYRFIHFSTHGLFDFESPDKSGLVLSVFDRDGEVEKQPVLGINDIYNLDLAADLVVLSACQTALGQELRGEGLVGVTRGFMYAGAPRVVSSLWKVDDPETARLMSSFYRKMLPPGRMTPVAALRAAQKEVWEDHKQSPFYWAAFELQGEWEALQTPLDQPRRARRARRRT